MAAVAGWIANFLPILPNGINALDWTTRRYGSKIDILFADTFKYEKQIQVTLASGKVYVGYVMLQPLEPHQDNSYVGVLPTISGYRDANNKEVEFMTSYEAIYEAEVSQDHNDFIKYFPMSDIIIASVFDPDVYTNWK